VRGVAWPVLGVRGPTWDPPSMALDVPKSYL